MSGDAEWWLQVQQVQVLERWLAKMPQSLVTREALRDLEPRKD